MEAEGIMARPAYLNLGQAGLRERIEQARELMGNPCRVCPRGCKVNRAEDDRRGFCRASCTYSLPSFYLSPCNARCRVPPAPPMPPWPSAPLRPRASDLSRLQGP